MNITRVELRVFLCNSRLSLSAQMFAAERLQRGRMRKSLVSSRCHMRRSSAIMMGERLISLARVATTVVLLVVV
jgi:hypothetical protein